MDDFIQDNGIISLFGPKMYQDAIDTPYDILTIGGVKSEGEPFPVFYTSFGDHVFQAFKIDLLKYLKGRKVVVWRVYPEIVQALRYPPPWEEGGRTITQYQIYSRLTAYYDISEYENIKL